MEWTRGPVLGRGSTATVSLATSTTTGELFAVKSTELSQSAFLQKEQQFLSNLSCPYIVKYIGSDVTNENNKVMYNLFMEYAAGGTLLDVNQRHGGRLDEAAIRFYTRSILLGLDYLHSNGLVHCDIKSQNVLVNQDGIKIADFGCARRTGVAGDDCCGTSGFSGTPAFMAPEVARGEEQEFPADIWAVGCTVIEMATGNHPWAAEAQDPVSVLYRIGFCNEVPENPKWLSEKGNDFLSKCFIIDPRKRWTVKQLLDHPFIDGFDQSDELQEFTMSSPSCVLDQDFWDSMEGVETPQNLTRQDCLNVSPVERIKRLSGCSFSSGCDLPNWSWEEDWITVRSSDIEEITNFEQKNVGMEDEPSASSTVFSLDSFTYEDELENPFFYEDFLLDFCIENISSNRNDITSTSRGYNFVSENLNFGHKSNENSFSVINNSAPFFLIFPPLRDSSARNYKNNNFFINKCRGARLFFKIDLPF